MSDTYVVNQPAMFNRRISEVKLQSRDSYADEFRLVEQAVAGDADAFGLIYASHLDMIYRYIYLSMQDAVLAEDMAEEVFIRAWKALPRYRSGSHRIKSWLYRIARNLIIDHFRKIKDLELLDEHLYLCEDSNPSVEEQAAHCYDISLLAGALQQLSEEEQQIIILRFIEGLPHPEVGTIVGKSPGACRVIQHRALARLSSIMADRQPLEEATTNAALEQ